MAGDAAHANEGVGPDRGFGILGAWETTISALSARGCRRSEMHMIRSGLIWAISLIRRWFRKLFVKEQEQVVKVSRTSTSTRPKP